MPFTGLFVAALIGVFIYCYLRMKKKYRFWKDRGVPSPETVPFLGNMSEVMRMKKHHSAMIEEIYSSYPGVRLVGYYDFTEPVVVVKDLSLVEQVLVKDFASYRNRDLYLDEESDPLEVNLFNLTDSKWKVVRNKMVPTFTTGKMKGMFSQMVECFENAVRQIDDEDVDITGVAGLYATDVIGTCAFGLNISKLGRPDSEFRKKSRTLFALSPKTVLKLLLMRFWRRGAKLLKLSVNPHEVLTYLEGIAKEALRARRESRETRDDFIHTMLQLLDKGSIELRSKDVTSEDDYLHTKDINNTESFSMTESLVISQVISFLLAGLEGTSVTVSLFCLEMALNPSVQERVRKEVEQTLNKHRKLTYEAIKDMEYLEMCVQETLRKYPIGSNVTRKAGKNCNLGGVDVPEGTVVVIPVVAIHYDPSYHPNPHTFHPERFRTPNTPFSHLPFGEGPRMCIGMRFALLEIKIALVTILTRYTLHLSSKTKLPVQFSPQNFALIPKDKIFIKLKKIPRSS